MLYFCHRLPRRIAFSACGSPKSLPMALPGHTTSKSHQSEANDLPRLEPERQYLMLIYPHLALSEACRKAKTSLELEFPVLISCNGDRRLTVRCRRETESKLLLKSILTPEFMGSDVAPARYDESIRSR